MAHNVETMAWANDIPWHGLGVEVESNLTPLQMLEAADLNWTVSKRPSYTIATPDWTEDVELIQAEDTYHIVRDSDNTILSHCGKNYVPFQNERVFEFFKRFTEAGQMTMETAGSLRNGKEIWGLADDLGLSAFEYRVGYEIYDDHVPLWENAQIPAIDIIDFDYPNLFYNHWHTQNDIPENCSPQSLHQVGTLLLNYIYD